MSKNSRLCFLLYFSSYVIGSNDSIFVQFNHVIIRIGIKLEHDVGVDVKLISPSLTQRYSCHDVDEKKEHVYCLRVRRENLVDK